MTLLHPERIGKYELLKFLGGGMSHVYMARDTLIGRTVAVKILTPSGAADEGTKARFIREAQLAGNVIHDNIIRVYDFGEEGGRLFMVMEFLEGEDLGDAIRQGHCGSLENRIAIAIQITRAMEHVHSLQIVHRDMKPQNVYITKSGIAKLMDFGIAKTVETSMTRTGFTVGTPSYMAPEQVLGKQVNHLSDVYAFGILLFELITDSKPWAAESMERLFFQVLNEPVDLERLRQAGAPESLIDLVGRCTAKDSASRPQSFEEVRRALEAIQSAAAPPVQPAGAAAPVVSPVPPPNRNIWLLAGGTGALAVLIAVAMVVWLSRKPADSTGSESKGPGTAEVQLAPVLSFPSGDMVLVSAGVFLFGEKKEPRETPAYYVDCTEVTNAAYRAFVKETGYTAPPGFSTARPEFPVVNVTIGDAREFARWAGKRLPTSVEWEKAARGVDGRTYPWGEAKQPELTATSGNKSLRSADTIAGRSPFGALEMAGNTWELVDEAMTASEGALTAFAELLSPRPTAGEPWCMIRGGSFQYPLIPVHEFGRIPERYRADDIGFRCVRDVK